MAALAAVLRLVGAGKGVVAGDDLYGGTSRLLAQVAPNLGIHVTNVDTTNIGYAPLPPHPQPHQAVLLQKQMPVGFQS